MMLVIIMLLLGAIAIVTGGLAIFGFIEEAKQTVGQTDPMLMSLLSACVLALGFLGILLK